MAFRRKRLNKADDRSYVQRMKMTKADRIVQFINGLFLLIFALSCLIPFLNVIGTSLATPAEILTRPFIIIPRSISFSAYQYIFSTPTVFRAVGVSIFVTLMGTLISMILTSLMAYGLSRTYLYGRRFLNFLVLFTMLFSGGMIPSFLIVSNLGLMDSLWALIIPGSISAYNLIIMRNFFQGISPSLEEAAKIDGANHFQIFTKVMLPLSKASLATISLFYAVSFWNAYQGAILYIKDTNKWPIQVLLRQIVLMASGSNFDMAAVDVVPPPQSVKMAVIIFATVPILIVYPFVQRYFIKGAMLGSVKG